jgi:hypothetical protein
MGDIATMNKKLIAIGITLLFIISAIQSVFAYYGQMPAAVTSSYKYSVASGINPQIIRLNNSEYYLIVWETSTTSGYARTVHIWDNNGSIQRLPISSYKFNSALMLRTGGYGMYMLGVVQIEGTDKYAVVYNDPDAAKTTVVTLQVWDTNGTIRPAVISTHQLTQNGTYSKIAHVAGHIYVVAYRDNPSADGWMETLWINDSGTINTTACATVEYDPANSAFGEILMIDSDTIAVVYQNSSSDGNLVTWNISSSGIFDAMRSRNWEFDTANSISERGIKKVSDNVYMISYTTTGNIMKIGTVRITPNGVITPAWIDSHTYGTDNRNYMHAFTINYGSVYGVGYSPSTALKFLNISTVNISSDGAIDSTVTNPFVVDNTNSGVEMSEIIHIKNNTYAIAARRSSGDWIQTFNISTNYASPVLSNPSPVNGTTGVLLYPACSITVNDWNGDLMTLDWYENTTGSWVRRQSNASCSNGTYSWTFAQVTGYGINYWWRIHVNDTLHNVSETYSFTTIAHHSTIYLIFPKNQSTEICRQPSCILWANNTAGRALTINFYENTTGVWIKRQLNSSVTANTTVQWNYSQASVDGESFYWNVTADDDVTNISDTYHFTTKLPGTGQNTNLLPIRTGDIYGILAAMVAFICLAIALCFKLRRRKQ